MKKYTEIFKLKEMFEKANIPFTFTDDVFGAKRRGEDKISPELYPAYQIRLNENIDVIQHFGSYGEAQDLLEIMGGLTVEEMQDDSVLGYLTAEEVFKRFKYCYEHNTSVYVEELRTKNQEQITEMAKIIDEMYYVYTTTADDIAEGLYNAGYRKIPENAVVMTKEEYIDLSRNYVTEQIEQARKKTAKEIYERLIELSENPCNGREEIYKTVFEKYGVEMEE